MATIQSETDCYDIIEVLGKGTFGEVAKGWRRSTGEMVAIKILKNDAYRSRIIKNELKLLRCMRGLDPDEAHIIRFLEFFHDALKFYLVFELLEQNLFEFQKENNFAPLPARHIRTVTLQVLRALARLKELAIIHADLKPENIMLVDQTRCPFRVKALTYPHPVPTSVPLVLSCRCGDAIVVVDRVTILSGNQVPVGPWGWSAVPGGEDRRPGLQGGGVLLLGDIETKIERDTETRDKPCKKQLPRGVANVEQQPGGIDSGFLSRHRRRRERGRIEERQAGR
ncbi:Hypothetical predicted protein [Marmota monax]|uniref:Protein kinase domain-containing protein n=1 Tax=Marmota monax TaxID=9995 RepID=A0A5E4AH36_MARMO|nr:hypothetical protein GHT09_019540 [Marmota monax]VTJ56290.1 Hypothetical predicted protein [Marmota monax]